MKTIYTITKKQAFYMVFQFMAKNPKSTKICQKSIIYNSSNKHHNALIMDSGADTSGIGETE